MSFHPKIPLHPPLTKQWVLNVAEGWYDPALVKINESAIGDLSDIRVENSMWENPDIDFLDNAMFTLALNTINHMFWDKVDGQFVRYEHDGKVGAVAMTSCFEKAWKDPQSPLRQALDHQFPLSPRDIESMFGPIPRLAERAQILNEVLLSPRLPQLASEALSMAENGQPFDVAFAHKLAQAFPLGYEDDVLKKAQLATSGVWRVAKMHGHASPCDLTAFADYQIPNVLRHVGVLEYDPQLSQSIDQMEWIEENSPEERAIRAASILAIEKIAQQHNVGVADVDYWIWLKRKEPSTPFHLTNTNKY